MAEVKNVLSIDMDYVMAPSIQLYNHYVGTILDAMSDEFGEKEGGFWGTKSKTFWEWMNDDLFCDKYLVFDQTKYQSVINLLKNKVKDISDENIYFGKEHDAILTFLCGDEKKADFTYNVYNVDHHHDIYYADEARDRIEKFACAGIAEWVWYLYDFGKLKNYYWISNDESKYPPYSLEDYHEFDTLHKIKEVSELEDLNFDYIFICKSEFYLPYKYQFLFDEVKKAVEEVKNTVFPINNESYCDGRSRFPIGW